MHRPQPARPAAGTGDRPEDLAQEVRAVAKIEALPTLLAVLCVTTGMRFAAVARVTENTWIACAIHDEINFGLTVGGELPVGSTLRVEAKRSLAPVVIEHASQDVRYLNHHAPHTGTIESYVSVPIVLPGGRYFGNLCTLDPAPAKVSDPKIIAMFERIAAFIATQLDSQITPATEQDNLRPERAADELREQFIAILGHDLRNPLQAIMVTSDLIAKKYPDPGLVTLAGRIKANSKRMSALMDDALDLARGRLGGGIDIRIEAVSDLNAGLRAVLNELQAGQPTRQIIANLDVTGSVSCDLRRVQQLASNLIGNALSHGAPDSIVKVTALSTDTEFVFEVWNDGQPIPSENLGKIFEPFWRRSSSGSQGWGLGLYICMQIVRAHGGSLAVTSSREAGTQFTARLPLGPAA